MRVAVRKDLSFILPQGEQWEANQLLCEAAESGKRQMINYLITKKGANVNNTAGRVSLCIARVLLGVCLLCVFLLSAVHDCLVNVSTCMSTVCLQWGATPLHCAAAHAELNVNSAPPSLQHATRD